ncbi:MAG: hypothetical protein IKJ49_08100 [Bacteroidaceae bacterium]|nr:hypothetical protein [Bacteroidaceae bacterium]
MKKYTFILALVMSMLSFTNAKADKLLIRYGESSIYAYQTHSVENAFDGKYDTKFWSNGCPQAGYTFTVYLGSSANVGDIKLYFDNGDLPADGTVIEVNENNSGNWVQVGESLNGVQANDVVTRNAGGVYTKQIRLRFTQASAYRFRLLEFEVYEYEERTISAVAGEGGSVTINGGSEAVTGTDEVQLVATPDYGYKFVRWTVGGEEVSTSAEYTDNTDGNKEYVAVFEKFASTDEWYAAIDKPTFGKTGNTTFITSATVDDVAVENIPEYIAGNDVQGVGKQSGVTTAIEVTPGAQFNLNITYQLIWGDLAIYQIDNDGATKEYGYYEGSWGTGDTGLVIENIKKAGVEVNDVSTVTYPISINENHNVGDVIVVRAITGDQGENNSAYEQGIAEGGYVDFLFVVAEEEEPAFSHTLTVTEDGWATLFLGFNARIPSAVEAYTVTTVNDGWVSLTQVTGVLPLNQGVIIKAPAGDYKFFYEETATADVTGNLLSGSAYNKNIDEEAYVLGKVDGVVGLYKAEKNQMDGTAWLNNANKAYLPASAVPNKSAAFYGFDWNGTTGIDEITDNREQSTAIYDLTGRRVENITASGIYVVGGKKVLVK